jgi:5-methylcytosine-specific restriction endonuclease McrA
MVESVQGGGCVKHRQPDPTGADPEPGEVPGIAPHPSAISTGSRVLLLNATFEPLAVVTAKRAVVLMLTGKAECVEVALTGAAFHSENLTIPAPLVMRLSRYVRVPYRRAVPMTRAGVLRRDGRRCAYCDRRADTIDHVVPRSRGGTHSWENCVAACRACNSKKADQLVEELGWTLTVVPRAPDRAAGGILVLAVEPLPAWEPWLGSKAA